MTNLPWIQNVFSLSVRASLLALFVSLGQVSVPVLAATPEEEQKATELIKVADEAKARAEQTEAALKAAQLKSTEQCEEMKNSNNNNDDDDDDSLLENDDSSSQIMEPEMSENESDLSLNDELNSTFTSHYKQEKSLYELDYIYADLEKGYRLYFKQVYATVVKR